VRLLVFRGRIKNFKNMPLIQKIAFLLLFSSISLSSFTQTRKEQQAAQSKNEAPTYPTPNKMTEVLNHISASYVDDVDEDALNEAAVKAMLEKLDPHSVYISSEDVLAANERIEGSFVGIGIRFQITKDTLYVVNCIPNGPSEKVGVLAGDKIIIVESDTIAGVGLKNSDVRKMLLGEKGSKVKISVLRGKNPKLLDFTITRDKIPVHSVASAYMVDDKVGYIKLTNFSRTSAQEVRSAVRDLKTQGMEDLIFDLQGNGGGLLSAAKYVADEFLADNKLIVYSEGRAQPRANLMADVKGNFESGRLIVLIDEYSASASEIVAGAIQDWDRGLLVGRRTFGKGLVQRPVQLSDGAQVRLTIARYYTPSGRYIQKPYDDLEEFKKDRYNRYLRGEMMHEDSIKFEDSLAYTTKITKRTVYGGGGIMPDKFVGLDTTEYSDLFRGLSRSGAMNTFSLNYVDANRKTIKENYPDLKTFINNFDVDEKMLAELFDLAAEQDTSINATQEDLALSKDLIEKRLKAMIAQNIWDQTAFYQIMNVKNEIFMKAYALLKENEYDLVNLHQN